ncbi:MAG: right-handed parallel beta-helix repeat-containing protein [Planctomycetota bacterium]
MDAGWTIASSETPCAPRWAARLALWLATVAVLTSSAGRSAADPSASIEVHDRAGLLAAAARATPGTRIALRAGYYGGGVTLTGLAGTAEQPIEIHAADADKPPVFDGGTSGLHLVDPVHVIVSGLHIRNASGNGINVDDGGTPETPARDVVLRDLVVKDIGSDGNCDGIKLSGVDGFVVERCTVERWGRSGSAVDMVGCQHGVITRCRFRHAPGLERGSGVQMKGGTRTTWVGRNHFVHAGARAINAGGSTGLDYFRPPLSRWTGDRFEAQELTIIGNVIVGSEASIAFVGVDGALCAFNTLLHPGRWALRILQENTTEGFVPCRNVDVRGNLIVFDSQTWREGGVNVGEGTAPTTFTFAGNHWFAHDAPQRTHLFIRTPTKDEAAQYGADPQLVDPQYGEDGVRPGSPAEGVGAHAFREATPDASLGR